jgi:hypothetical protein
MKSSREALPEWGRGLEIVHQTLDGYQFEKQGCEKTRYNRGYQKLNYLVVVNDCCS